MARVTTDALPIATRHKGTLDDKTITKIHQFVTKKKTTLPILEMVNVTEEGRALSTDLNVWADTPVPSCVNGEGLYSLVGGNWVLSKLDPDDFPCFPDFKKEKVGEFYIASDIVKRWKACLEKDDLHDSLYINAPKWIFTTNGRVLSYQVGSVSKDIGIDGEVVRLLEKCLGKEKQKVKVFESLEERYDGMLDCEAGVKIAARIRTHFPPNIEGVFPERYRKVFQVNRQELKKVLVALRPFAKKLDNEVIVDFASGVIRVDDPTEVYGAEEKVGLECVGEEVEAEFEKRPHFLAMPKNFESEEEDVTGFDIDYLRIAADGFRGPKLFIGFNGKKRVTCWWEKKRKGLIL